MACFSDSGETVLKGSLSGISESCYVLALTIRTIEGSAFRILLILRTRRNYFCLGITYFYPIRVKTLVNHID